MNIVICAPEVFPFAKTGGLADVTGALPLALEELGQNVVIFMPKYRQVSEGKWQLNKLKNGLYFTKIGKDIKVYFIEHQTYYNRQGLYGEKAGDYPDNLERFSFFCRKTLDFLRDIEFKPDIIHIHDWQSSLVAVYLKTVYKGITFYKDIKVLLTIHNIGYQGLFPKEEFSKLGLNWSLFNIEGLEFYDQINLLKGGIIFSDAINTVSPTYSKEIQTKEFGFGLEGVLRKKSDRLYGILNGIDYNVWNPQTDKLIFKNYSESNFSAKYENKINLQKICNLAPRDVAIFGLVSRLAEQKGWDILAEAIDELCNLDLELVILGTGDIRYHNLLEEISKRYPKVCSVNLRFDEILAHRIYAGSDIFLMPSKYEPCGLGQMISLRYGTVPLVFKTGGLADTVTEENGFVFDSYTKEALIAKVKEAIATYKDKSKWVKLIKRAFSYNFSWQDSAKKYLELYQKILNF
ncbi:MAG: glycogen synthase GlgA [Candidatus Omnitrophica bacterium]|nr:glycogen synthase GlgA [Candidatus Omnitrophota bacterium]MCM8799394.1 glycogen synthase GlgA [Candidatus Omnitrophota bacterium]